MREIFYAYTDTEIFADYGTQTEIARDDTRLDKIQKMFADEIEVNIIHSHPIGNLKLSNTDIDTFKGWCFSLGKSINIILVSGAKWTHWWVYHAFGKINIAQLEEIYQPISRSPINDREHELIIKAITESDYVPHLTLRPRDDRFTSWYEFTPGKSPYLVDRD